MPKSNKCSLKNVTYDDLINSTIKSRFLKQDMNLVGKELCLIN